MTAGIADTDILSTFGKVGRLDLLLLLFHKVYIASAVYHELLRAEHFFDRYPQLGNGEIESFVLAQSHRLICLTNDRQAKAVARALGLSYLDLEGICDC
jgi:predicted nucleic acid-binding protein